ncbi:MAG TPA: kelch repeat-containing protein [Sandaracinaceae bacterium LLY-WYZ-13_1]|nr:kelch repeat-containing protein [Sandaracinaceae bacterium LLY-WYZ-13_1]
MMRPTLRALRLAAALSLLVACGDDEPTDAGVDAGTALDGEVPEDAGPMSTMRPSKRSDVAGVVDPESGTFVIFGGDDGPIVNQIPRPVFRDDTWIFEPGYGWTEVETSSAPSARARYGVAYDPVERRMFLFGGRYREEGASGDYTLFNDLWAFDFETREWEMLHEGLGVAPGPRFSPALAFDADSGTLYVAAGGLNANALSPDPAADLWAYDGTSWSEIAISGTPPSTRLFEAWAHDATRGRLVAFGGQVGDFFTPSFDDFYALDLETGAWSQLDDGSGAGPIGRFNGMLTHDEANDRYLLFGGHADPGVMNDLWAWDAASGGWSELALGDTFTGAGLGCIGNPQEIPEDYVDQDLVAPERRQGGMFEIHEGQVWLFGGESDCSDHLDDTWTYDLDADAWSEVLEARAGESCARRGDDCMCLCI